MMKHEMYSFKVRYSQDDDGYIAECPEFPGLSAFGDTPGAAIEEAEIALALFIETYKEEGRKLPNPKQLREYSGQMRIRLPKSLHARLANTAEDEGVSINTLIIHYLSQGITAENKNPNFENILHSDR